MPRKPWYLQKKVIFTIIGIGLMIASFFLAPEQMDKTITIVGTIVMVIGYILGEAWTDAQALKSPLQWLEEATEEDDENNG